MINPTKSPLDHPQLTKPQRSTQPKTQIKLRQPRLVHCDQPNQKLKPNSINHRDQKPNHINIATHEPKNQINHDPLSPLIELSPTTHEPTEATHPQ